MVMVNMHEAKSQLSRLGRAAWEGEEVVIAKAGEPYLRLVPYREQKPRRRLGAMKGRIRIAPDFDETPPEVIDAFRNSEIFPRRPDSAPRHSDDGGVERRR